MGRSSSKATRCAFELVIAKCQKTATTTWKSRRRGAVPEPICTACLEHLREKRRKLPAIESARALRGIITVLKRDPFLRRELRRVLGVRCVEC